MWTIDLRCSSDVELLPPALFPLPITAARWRPFTTENCALGFVLRRLNWLSVLWHWCFQCPAGFMQQRGKVKNLFHSQIKFCLSPDQADFQAVRTGRRRTCALLNSPLPCVNNAIQHIQELKVTVENWCQQVNRCQMWRGDIVKLNMIQKGSYFPFCLVPVWKISTADQSGKASTPQDFQVKSSCFILLYSEGCGNRTELS